MPRPWVLSPSCIESLALYPQPIESLSFLFFYHHLGGCQVEKNQLGVPTLLVSAPHPLS